MNIVSDIISSAVSKLSAITEKSPIDWKAFDEALASLEDINVFNEQYEETILSEYITDGEFYERGEVLLIAIQHFLTHGYDVHANNGRNGGLALSSLCWSSYDRNILEAAKILMEAGAPVIYRSSDDEPDEEPRGLLGSIGWKISGAWAVDKDFYWANILEAYYQMAELNVAQKDYMKVSCFTDCIGTKLTGVSTNNLDEAVLMGSENVKSFAQPLVMWFDNKPLVISPYVEFVVNPIYAAENKTKLINANSAFEALLGAELTDIHYFDSTICYLEFSNGYYIVFASRDIGDRKRIGTFEIRQANTIRDIRLLKINRVCGAKGFTYASTVTNYDETALALFCDDEAYMLHVISGKNSKHQMRLFRCSEAMLSEYTRQYPMSSPNKIMCFYEEDELTGMRFEYDDEFLYFKTTDYYEIEVILSDYQFDPLNCTSLHSQPGRHIDFEKRSIDF